MRYMQTVRPNTRGRDFVVGDIHGWLEPLMDALDEVDFDADTDRLFCVGDLIDRGPDSEHCLKLTSAPWFYTVRGNHEQMMFDWLENRSDEIKDQWMRYGGLSWLGEGPASYFAAHPEMERLALSLTETLPYVIAVPTQDDKIIAICHSTLALERWSDLPEQMQNPQFRHQLLWDRPLKTSGFKHNTQGLFLSVHGHEIVPQPTRVGNAVYIDTGAALLGMRGASNTTHTPRLTLLTLEELAEVEPRPASA